MRTQRGGNDMTNVKIPDLPVPPKAHFTDSALLEIPHIKSDPVILSGGKKKRTAGKKPAAKTGKPGKPGKKGGALVDDIKNLAVPFAILLAKQGLDGMFNKKAEKKTTVKATAKRSAKSATGGSGCSSCATKTGGSAKNRYAQLSAEIDKFLSNY